MSAFSLLTTHWYWLNALGWQPPPPTHFITGCLSLNSNVSAHAQEAAPTFNFL